MITLQTQVDRMFCLTINIPTPLVVVTLSAIALIVVLLLLLLRRHMLCSQKNLRAIVDKECEKVRRQAYISLLETIPMPIAAYDQNGKCIFLNSWCKKITRHSDIGDAPNIYHSQILSKENLEKLKNGENISGDAFINYDNEELAIFGNKVNEKLAIRYSIQRVFQPNGKAFNYILAISDITHYYAHQQRANDFQALLSDCLQLTGIAAYVYDVAKDKYFRLNGSDIVPMSFNAEYVFQHIAPQYRGQYIEMFLRVKNGEISTDRRCYSLMSSTNNKPYYVETFTYGTTDVTGKVSRILQTIRNVTENQEKLRELNGLKLILSKALPIAGIVAWRYDVSSHIFMRTDFASYNKNTSFDELCSTVHPDDRDKFLSTFDKLSQGELHNAHITLRMASQSADWLFYEIYAIPMLNDIGSVSAILGIRCDMSDYLNTKTKFKSIREKTMALVEVTQAWILDYCCIDKSLIVYSWKDGYGKSDAHKLMNLVHEDDREIIATILNKINLQQIDSYKTVVRARIDKNSDFYEMEFCCKAYEYVHGLPTRYAAFVRKAHQ